MGRIGSRARAHGPMQAELGTAGLDTVWGGNGRDTWDRMASTTDSDRPGCFPRRTHGFLRSSCQECVFAPSMVATWYGKEKLG
jgi:hypothetical protein